MLERKHHPLLTQAQFALRLLLSAAAGLGLIAGSLVAGMIGYHTLESMPWVDAFANAAMILSGMGPLEPMKTTAGKIFAGCYALYSGLALIVIVGIIFAPIAHRFLHRFHAEESRSNR